MASTEDKIKTTLSMDIAAHLQQLVALSGQLREQGQVQVCVCVCGCVPSGQLCCVCVNVCECV